MPSGLMPMIWRGDGRLPPVALWANASVGDMARATVKAAASAVATRSTRRATALPATGDGTFVAPSLAVRAMKTRDCMTSMLPVSALRVIRKRCLRLRRRPEEYATPEGCARFAAHPTDAVSGGLKERIFQLQF